MKTNDSPMPEVYAVFAIGTGYHDELELVRIFGAEADAEAFAQTLRETTVDDEPWPGVEPDPVFDYVRVAPYSVN